MDGCHQGFSMGNPPGLFDIPSGELTFCHGKSPFFMGKSTISMAIFHCYVSSPGRVKFISNKVIKLNMIVIVYDSV